MLGWSGVCYQFYQIYNYEHQQQMIQIDGYPYVEVDIVSQLLIYSFPREDCIRLDELLNLIRSDYVKIYGAQALKLIQAIIQHHGQIREKKIFHGNLTSRNVWIVFGNQSQGSNGSNGSERLRCIFSKLNYKIHFTGYQKEPMKGNYDLDNECSQVVTDILNVLEDCQSGDDRKAQSKKQMSLEKIKLMLLPYAQEQYKLLEQIEKIFQDYNYDKDEQRLKELDSKQYTKANSRGGDTFKKPAKTIKILFQENPIQQLNTLNDKVKWRMSTLMKEIQFWNLLPKFVKEVQATIYGVDLKKELKPIEPSIIELIQTINGLKSIHYRYFLEEFQKELDEEFGMVFKIDIKLDQTVTEPHYMNLFRATIAEHMNDLDSFKSLNDKWLKNKKEFEAAIFKKHKPYLLQKNVELFVKDGEAFVASLV